jgi:hypothetical protein
LSHSRPVELGVGAVPKEEFRVRLLVALLEASAVYSAECSRKAGRAHGAGARHASSVSMRLSFRCVAQSRTWLVAAMAPCAGACLADDEHVLYQPRRPSLTETTGRRSAHGRGVKRAAVPRQEWLHTGTLNLAQAMLGLSTNQRCEGATTGDQMAVVLQAGGRVHQRLLVRAGSLLLANKVPAEASLSHLPEAPIAAAVTVVPTL